MLTTTIPYERHLGNRLTVRSVADSSDVERIAALNGTVHDEGVATMARELVLHHPDTRPEHWLYVEDDDSREVVSALCLIPWPLDVGGVRLMAGEVGLVGTLEAYRRRGLVRAMFERHHELLREGGYDLGIIQGIPYFYRQFGYQYALPLEGGWHLELRCLPDLAKEGERGYSFAQATVEDVPTLCRLYDEAVAHLDISVRRSPEQWRYLLGPSLRTEMVSETWLVLDRAGQAVAYLRVPAHGFVDGLMVNEVSHVSAPMSRAILAQLKAWATDRNKPFVRLTMHPSHPLIAAAEQYETADRGHYAWQIHVVDPGRLLQKLAPVLERRLVATPHAGLTASLTLSLYRQAWQLTFQEGRLTQVTPLGFHEGSDIRLPPELAAPLFLGHHTWRELRPFYPDVSVATKWQRLADVLFPKMRAYLYTIY